MAMHSGPVPANADDESAASKRPPGRHRVGAVAYGYQYSIGLFSYKDRPGTSMRERVKPGSASWPPWQSRLA